ncbi:MAG TPA: hypothetical protein EYP14_02620 [Planctomycetaceae bacterium]|nr:hypothetical protein [Planctomycetaceae bacterium]
MLKSKPDGEGDYVVNTDKGGSIDEEYVIEFSWHTHPRSGDPWPSGKDKRESRHNNIVGVMISYQPRWRFGKIEDHWFLWITDVDGEEYDLTDHEIMKSEGAGDDARR